MKTRKLGNSGLEVSALGFGCMGLSFPDAPGKGEVVKLLRSAFEEGITFLIQPKLMATMRNYWVRPFLRFASK
ncbi:hypothetical protein [Pedobacter panaciterrae]